MRWAPLVRAIPFTNDGEPEALDCWLERQADAMRLTLGQTAERIGILSKRKLPAFWGVMLSDLDAGRLADMIPEIAPRSMTLQRYDGILFDLAGLHLGDPGSLRPVTRRQWIFAAGSRWCPDCLADSHQWPLWWKVPWAFACTRHRTYLHDICPRCDLRPRTYRKKGTTQPAYLGQIPVPGCCTNQPISPGLVGAGAQPCGYMFSRSMSVVAPDHVVHVQQVIADWAAARSVEVFGRVVSPRAAFHLLQSAMVLLWHEMDLHDGAEEARRAHWRVPPLESRSMGDLTVAAWVALSAPSVGVAAEMLVSQVGRLIAVRSDHSRVFHELVSANTHPLTGELLDRMTSLIGRPATRRRRHLRIVEGGGSSPSG